MRQTSISLSLAPDITPGCAQANFPLESLTCTQPSFVRFPVTGSSSLKDATTLFGLETGVERRLPFTKIVQSLLFDGALELGFFSDFVAVNDEFDAAVGDDDTLSVRLAGATGLRVAMPIANAAIANTPPIPMANRSLLGKGVAEAGLVETSAKFDDFTAGVGVGWVGCTGSICVDVCSTVFADEDTGGWR